LDRPFRLVNATRTKKIQKVMDSRGTADKQIQMLSSLDRQAAANYSPRMVIETFRHRKKIPSQLPMIFSSNNSATRDYVSSTEFSKMIDST
jgi:hypothetical protein